MLLPKHFVECLSVYIGVEVCFAAFVWVCTHIFPYLSEPLFRVVCIQINKERSLNQSMTPPKKGTGSENRVCNTTLNKCFLSLSIACLKTSQVLLVFLCGIFCTFNIHPQCFYMSYIIWATRISCQLNSIDNFSPVVLLVQYRHASGSLQK